MPGFGPCAFVFGTMSSTLGAAAEAAVRAAFARQHGDVKLHGAVVAKITAYLNISGRWRCPPTHNSRYGRNVRRSEWGIVRRHLFDGSHALTTKLVLCGGAYINAYIQVWRAKCMVLIKHTSTVALAVRGA